MSIKIQIKTLPNKPGVYQFFDKENGILYVGKAKDLKKRVSSYFNSSQKILKTKLLVKKIHSIEHIVVNTEADALLLENNLIKKYKPRYNVMLKDDKTYPWICIKKENFPRIFLTRNVIKDGSEYFGPYASIRTAKTLLSLINDLFKLRNCNYNLSENNINSKKFKLCLDYHIGNCKAPCEGLQTHLDYIDDINSIRNIIKGNFNEAIESFKEAMISHSDKLEFEKAQEIKEKIELLANYQSKSTIISPTISDVDVFSIISDPDYSYINFLKITNGAIIQSHTSEIKKKLDEQDKKLLELAIIEIRKRFNSQSKEIYVPFEVNLGEELKITIPKIGDKKRILELSFRNAKYYRQDSLKQLKIVDPKKHTNRIMEQMKKDLRLSVQPRHIECFDNSNLQGTNPVAACVVFKNGKPSKKDYRHFNIKTVEGADDFASMEEVVFRRYKRLVEEKQELPNLIIVDGGKGQLSSGLKSLDKLKLRKKIAIIGIAKRLEEIYYPNDPYPLHLDKKSETLKIIQYLRNEAHRFGIEHHRKKRRKKSINTELENISGIGEKTIVSLLKYFKSKKRISETSIESLEKIIGADKASKVFNYYNNMKKE